MKELKNYAIAAGWLFVVVTALLGPFVYLAWKWVEVNWLR